jgi:dTDP-4-amino-4,6-dideoxygalactose transaminase
LECGNLFPHFCFMQIVQAPRASAILYNLLVSQASDLPWLMPANICPIVPITFFKAHVPFEFVDISAETLHMDQEQSEALIKKRKYGGLLYAHTYGESSAPDDFFANFKSLDPELLILDDRCLCIPDLEPDHNSSADVILYSTGYAKIVELNFGGYAFMRVGVPYQPQQLPFSAQDREELEESYKESIAKNSKFIYRDSNWLETESDLPAKYDYQQLIKNGLKESLQQRATLNAIYAAKLPVEIQLSNGYQTWRFNIRVKNKKHIYESIFKAGLFASSHYASLAGIMSGGRAPQAEMLANEIINLFNDHHFSAYQAGQVCAAIVENLN